MSRWLGSLFQRNAHSPARRLYFSALRRFRAVFSKRQSVHFVDIGGRRYKRVVLGDSFEASRIEEAMIGSPDPARFPPLIARHENELLLGFIEGRAFDPSRDDDREALAGFIGALYSADRSTSPPVRLVGRLEIDLRFLADSGVIDRALAESLRTRADEARPERIENGFDYVDPVAKNFVIGDGGLHAIDVESLRRGAPIGVAIAKAGLHWLERDRLGAFIDAVDRNGGGACREQYRFVELCFRVAWIKRKLLQGKHRSIRPTVLRELVE